MHDTSFLASSLKQTHARKLSGKGNTKNYYQISLNLLGRLCKVITGQLNNLNLLGSECRASVSNYSKSASSVRQFY